MDTADRIAWKASYELGEAGLWCSIGLGAIGIGLGWLSYKKDPASYWDLLPIVVGIVAYAMGMCVHNPAYVKFRDKLKLETLK